VAKVDKKPKAASRGVRPRYSSDGSQSVGLDRSHHMVKKANPGPV